MKACSVSFFALLLAVALLLTGAATAQKDEQPNLGKMDLGSYVTGPEISLKDLRGRVVVVEFWGITCGPCIKGIPHTTELAKEYGHEKLVIIANQSWSASDKECKTTWEEHAKSQHVAVRNGGKLPGFTPTSFPHAVIFDHTGKFLWEGHPGGMDRIIADAVKNMPEKPETSADDSAKETDQAKKPEPIITASELKYFDKDAQQINEQDRPITATLAKLRRAAEKSAREEQLAEAKAILDTLSTWTAKQLADAQADRTSDPASAYVIAQKMSDWLGRDELATPFNEMKQAFESDAAMMDAIRSMSMLREVQALAKSIGLDADPAAAIVDRANAKTLRLIARDLNKIISAWPDTEAGKQAKALLDQWALKE